MHLTVFPKNENQKNLLTLLLKEMNIKFAMQDDLDALSNNMNTAIKRAKELKENPNTSLDDFEDIKEFAKKKYGI